MNKLVLILVAIFMSFSSVAQLVFERNDYIKQNSVQINDSEQVDALFGYSLAASDNLLVIGAPRESSGGEKGGAVYLLYGNNQNGLNAHPFNIRISQDTPGVTGNTEDGDFFGGEVVIGYFAERPAGLCQGPSCNGWRDVIVGVPGETVTGVEKTGMVNILFGGNPDCTAMGSTLCDALGSFHQGTDSIIGINEPDDRYGTAMVVGDFNEDMADDLVIGVPREDLTNVFEATDGGSISVLYGDSSNLADFFAEGLTSYWDESFSQQNLTGQARDDENFGYALAAGDFNRDGQDDLAVGVPNDVQTDGANRIGGSINVIYGLPYEAGALVDPGGLTFTGNRDFNQDFEDVFSPPMIGVSEDGDDFGYALASGDFNKDGYDDLAIGVPGEDVSNNTISNAGAVAIMYGSDQTTLLDFSGGLTSSGNQLLFQGNNGINGAAESGDRFGSVLAVGDMNSDGVDDLIVGNYLEDVGDVKNAGAVSIIYGYENIGLQASNNDIQFDQSSLSNPGVVTENFQFGYSLAVGDFDCDGKDDLAIGSRGSYVNSLSTVYYPGAVTIIYQKEHDLISRLPMEEVDWGDCLPSE
ncbi:MAG: hypothetical protein AB8B80_05285 [Marinicellaceae bacterium]